MLPLNDSNRLFAVDLLLKKKPTNELLLTWLALFAGSLLEPTVDVGVLPEEQIHQFQQSMRESLVALKSFTYHQVFKARSAKQSRKIILKYHKYYVTLLNRMAENQSYFKNNNQRVADCFQQVYSYLLEMIGWLEDRYPRIRKSNSIPPRSYSDEALVLIEKLLNSIKKALNDVAGTDRIIVLIERVCLIESRQLVAESLCSYKELEFKREFLDGLDKLSVVSGNDDCLNAVELLLIDYNFNHRIFTDYLIDRVERCLQVAGHTPGRIARMHALRSLVVQAFVQKRCPFDPQLESLEPIMTRFLEERILQLESLMDTTTSLSNTGKDSTGTEPRVRCNLSIYQLALIFRAADEEKVIEAKSLSAIFRTIAPLISTAHKQCISADSMRSKCYNAEPRDIKNTIEILERIMLRIRNY
ncbi:hypothetical protein GCM10027051_30220 [Niabella terrae]